MTAPHVRSDPPATTSPAWVTLTNQMAASRVVRPASPTDGAGRPNAPATSRPRRYRLQHPRISENGTPLAS